MRRTILSLIAGAWLAAPGIAVAGDGDESAFQSVITHQLQAFARDDGASAYADAAPNVQTIFPSPDVFMNMVRNGYAPVYRNDGYSFMGTGTDQAGRSFEKVQLHTADGASYKAYYFMEQQPDGTWKISGCVVLKEPDAV
ncbi:MAG: DUF4864 domain-containing protein [Alphaproteobacteria bacterium]|nr:DUF4864 domain-containing protein [Alphaproteobacteria bacterium]